MQNPQRFWGFCSLNPIRALPRNCWEAWCLFGMIKTISEKSVICHYEAIFAEYKLKWSQSVYFQTTKYIKHKSCAVPQAKQPGNAATILWECQSVLRLLTHSTFDGMVDWCCWCTGGRTFVPWWIISSKTSLAWKQTIYNKESMWLRSHPLLAKTNGHTGVSSRLS